MAVYDGITCRGGEHQPIVRGAWVVVPGWWAYVRRRRQHAAGDARRDRGLADIAATAAVHRDRW